MKICILTPRFPIPECGGDLLRINFIARYLKSQGHQLVLVSYTEQEADILGAKEIYDEIYTTKRKKAVSIFFSILYFLTGRPIQCGYYYSLAYKRLFSHVIQKEKPDLYISHLLRMLPFIENIKQQDHTIVEMTDALSKTYALSSKGKGDWLLRSIYKIEKKLIARFESYVIEHYPKVVLVSQSDIDFLCDNMPNKDVSSIALHTNGVEVISSNNKTILQNKICFIGHMQSLQNQDAVIHFVEDIFPLLLKDKPNMKFYVVGAHPPKNIQRLDNGYNIFVTGYVKDIDSFINNSCLAVAPIQIAAGIQNKILVAMANAVPVVLTPLIAKAIPELQNGENCLICEDSQKFASACLSLIEDKELNEKIRTKGYEMVARYYSWHEKLKGYEIITKNR